MHIAQFSDTLGEATQKLKAKRIAVKPLKIQTDSDDVISQLTMKNRKKDTKKLQLTAAKHQNEQYLLEFAGANSSSNTNFFENMVEVDPLGSNKSMKPTTRTPTPSEDQENRPSAVSVQLQRTNDEYETDDYMRISTPFWPEHKRDRPTLYEDRDGEMVNQMYRTSTLEASSDSSSGYVPYTPKKSRKNDRSQQVIVIILLSCQLQHSP